ncbi:MAG: hypothetical protein H0W88_02895 [Parachlamydiaceae bacterium]|nr:hypothetical protein [Parachlamydiaceae bacterium]
MNTYSITELGKISLLINSDHIEEATNLLNRYESILSPSLAQNIFIILDELTKRNKSPFKSRVLTVIAANTISEMLQDYFVPILQQKFKNTHGDNSGLPKPTEKYIVRKMMSMKDPFHIVNALSNEELGLGDNFYIYIKDVAGYFGETHLFESLISRVWIETRLALNPVDYKNFEKDFARGLSSFYNNNFNTNVLVGAIQTHLIDTQPDLSHLDETKIAKYKEFERKIKSILMLLKVKNKTIFFIHPCAIYEDKTLALSNSFHSVKFLKNLFSFFSVNFLVQNEDINYSNIFMKRLKNFPKSFTFGKIGDFLNNDTISKKFAISLRKASSMHIANLIMDFGKFIINLEEVLKSTARYNLPLDIFQNYFSMKIMGKHLEGFKPHLDEINDYPMRVNMILMWMRNQIDDFKERFSLFKDFLLFIRVTDLKNLETTFGKIPPSQFIRYSQTITGKSLINLYKSDKEFVSKMKSTLTTDPDFNEIIETFKLWVQQLDFIRDLTYQLEPHVNECLDLAPLRTLSFIDSVSKGNSKEFLDQFFKALSVDKSMQDEWTQVAPIETSEEFKETKETKGDFKSMSLGTVGEDSRPPKLIQKSLVGEQVFNLDTFELGLPLVHGIVLEAMKLVKSKCSKTGVGTLQAFTQSVQHAENLFSSMTQLHKCEEDNKEKMYSIVLNCISEGNLILEQLLLGIDLFYQPTTKAKLPSRYSHNLIKLSNRSLDKLKLNSYDLGVIINVNKGEIDCRRVAHIAKKDPQSKTFTEAQRILHQAYHWLHDKNSKQFSNLKERAFKLCTNILSLSYKLALLMNRTYSKENLENLKSSLDVLNKQIIVPKQSKPESIKPKTTDFSENCKKEIEVNHKILSILMTEENMEFYETDIDNLLRNQFIVLKSSVESMPYWHVDPSSINLSCATILRQNHFIAQGVLGLILSLKGLDENIEEMGHNLAKMFVKAGFNLEDLDKNVVDFLEASYGTINFTRYQSNYSSSDSKEGQVIKVMKKASQLKNKKELALVVVEEGFELVASAESEAFKNLQKTIFNNLTCLRALLEHILI